MKKHDESLLADNQLQSYTISFLRFPLIVGVVMIHAHFTTVVSNGVNLVSGHDSAIYDTLSFFLSGIIFKISVPLFFFFSGFLFFLNIKDFTYGTYCSKLKRRASTLLLPYGAWNALTLLVFFVQQTFFPSLSSGLHKFIVDYSIRDWITAFWDVQAIDPENDFGGHYPMCGPFWFLRDLMVTMLFSPLIYLWIRGMKFWGVLVLAFCWAFGFWFTEVGLGRASVFFFTFGAYFSLNKINFMRVMSNYCRPLLPFYVLTAIIIWYYQDQEWSGYLHNFNVLAGLFLCVGFCSRLIKKGVFKVNHSLTGCSFFVYAGHFMPLALLIKCSFLLLHPNSSLAYLLIYILCPTIVILLLCVVCLFLKKHFPSIAFCLMGGR